MLDIVSILKSWVTKQSKEGLGIYSNPYLNSASSDFLEKEGVELQHAARINLDVMTDQIISGIFMTKTAEMHDEYLGKKLNLLSEISNPAFPENRAGEKEEVDVLFCYI